MWALLAAACSSSPVPPGELADPPPAAAESTPAPLAIPALLPTGHFSGEWAAYHAQRLADWAPRLPATPNEYAARDYLRAALVGSGADLLAFDHGPGEAPHIVAEIPGRSPDPLLLIAPYPTREQDAWIGDDGAALLLELTRVLAIEVPTYTVRIALAATPGRRPIPDSPPEISPKPPLTTPAEARSDLVAAGESLASVLASAGHLDGIRGIIVFDLAARPGLQIARDLRSHPVYRDVFWSSAAAKGLKSMFPAEAGWASSPSLHLGFRARGMHQVVALVDEARARPELAPISAGTLGEAAVYKQLGDVTLESLARIMDRLARIDAFSEAGAAPAPPSPALRAQASPRIPESPPSS